MPLHVRGAIAVLQGFATLERGEMQRQAVTAWVNHLAWMLAHPYGDRGHA